MKITRYGQSAILIEEYKDTRILIDPGRYCYGKTGLTPSDFSKIDILLLTHKHGDHCTPEAIKILLENNPTLLILGNSEVKEKLNSANLDCDVIAPGDTHEVNGITIKGVKQIHGDLPSGDPKPENIGFLIDDKLYHTGDTIYMEEKPHADVLFVPICGKVVLDIPGAIRYAKEVQAKLIIPIHYDNPAYPVDPQNFKNAAEGLNVRILGFGESVEF